MLVNGQEVEAHYTEYGIMNTSSGHVLEGYETQSAAEFDALLYAGSVVVEHEVYVTKWRQSGEMRELAVVSDTPR